MKKIIPYVMGTLISSMMVFSGCKKEPPSISIKEESLKTLKILTAALYDMQIHNQEDSDFGALQCVNCNVLHTRAAEAVYPFSIIFEQTKDDRFLQAAINLGNWLIRQQYPDGSWQETPEEWTGTTTDQLLMMVLAHQILKEYLNASENEVWENAIRRAADYLTEVMDADFASINYCTTTAASLSMTHKYYNDQKYLQKARVLAREILSKTDEDGFIKAEGDRVYGVKYGSDIGYEIDMSLWGLTLYADLAGDEDMKKMLKKSVANHLYFIYPNGAVDGSWGIRSNKWTTYGSLTADGCQILFSLYAREDARCRTAAYKNLTYLRTMIRDGLVGYGPHHWELFDGPPCNYPTFVRAKNLAMAFSLGDQDAGPCPELPADSERMVKVFPTMDVALVRSENFMATVTAYRYQDLRKTYKSKYMHRPAGGSISNLWVKDYGFLQLGGQTEYQRWEPMSFPIVENTRCITPRIEFVNENGYFTNLYEFNGRMTVENNQEEAVAVVTTSGELSNKNLLPGGVAYTLQHTICDNIIEKRIILRYHDGYRNIKIVEPIIWQKNMQVRKLDDKQIRIETEGKSFLFEVVDGDVDLFAGDPSSAYWSVYPAVRTIPIELTVKNTNDAYRQELAFKIMIEQRPGN